MSSKFSSINWLWVIAGGIIGFVLFMGITLVVNVGYGVVLGFQMRGTPPQDILYAALSSTPFMVMSLLWTIVGSLIGGRMAGKHAGDAATLAGLLAGILMAIAILILQRDLGMWTLSQLILAVAGGAVGGWFASRHSESDWDEQYA